MPHNFLKVNNYRWQRWAVLVAVWYRQLSDSTPLDGLSIGNLKAVDGDGSGDYPFYGFYTVSGKKVNHFIHFHNSGKQCRILVKFCSNNAASNCKQSAKFQ